MKNRIYIILLLFFLLPLINGCGGYHKQIYTGPDLTKLEISTITTDDQFVTIGGYDGNNTIDKSSPKDLANIAMWGRYPRTITVMPGQHKILPCVQKPYQSGCSEYWLEVEAKPGDTYIIKSKFEKDTKRYVFWIEKQNETEKTMHQIILGH